MTPEEALRQVMQAIAPASLNALQIDVFCRSWNKQSYHKIAGELNHEYSYIKDVGAELWQSLSQTLDTPVTKLNLPEAVARYAQREQMHNLPASPHKRVDWGEALDVSDLCGRQAQLEQLEQWVMQDRCRLVAIVGMGGIGKTMLATQLAQQLVDTEAFEVVVWRSLRQAPPLFNFLVELLQTIAPNQPLPLRLDDAMRQLMEQLRTRRCLLILDNVETVFSDRELVGTYRPDYEDYGWLFQQLGQGRHQSCVLLISREIPIEVAIAAAPNSLVRLLRLKKLSIEEGAAILAVKGLRLESQLAQVQVLIERYQGNPLALEVVATSLRDTFDSDIATFLAQETLLYKEINDLLAQQLARLSELEWQVVGWLATHGEAITVAELQTNLSPTVSPAALQNALISLDRRSLIETIKPSTTQFTDPTKLSGVRYALQSIVMEYIIQQSIERFYQEVEQALVDCFGNPTLLKGQPTSQASSPEQAETLQSTCPHDTHDISTVQEEMLQEEMLRVLSVNECEY